MPGKLVIDGYRNFMLFSVKFKNPKSL